MLRMSSERTQNASRRSSVPVTHDRKRKSVDSDIFGEQLEI
jgi:hypothetical protein